MNYYRNRRCVESFLSRNLQHVAGLPTRSQNSSFLTLLQFIISYLKVPEKGRGIAVCYKLLLPQLLTGASLGMWFKIVD